MECLCGSEEHYGHTCQAKVPLPFDDERVCQLCLDALMVEESPLVTEVRYGKHFHAYRRSSDGEGRFYSA